MADRKLIVSTEVLSLASRLGDPGETVIRSGDCLGKTNFQKLYQGTGVPRQVDGSIMLASILNFADEISIPLNGCWENPSDRSPWSERLDRLEHCGDTPPEDGYDCVRRSSREAAADLSKAFSLETGEGVVQLYTSESKMTTVEMVRSWSVDCYDGENHEFGRKELKIYKAINKVIGEDDYSRLVPLMPYIKGMNYYLNETLHPAGELYSGISVNADSRGQLICGNRVRVARILSTSSVKSVASDHVKDLSDTILGLLLIIQVPDSFWGCRQISGISQYDWEKESIFPAYSQFEVTGVCWTSSPPTATLKAIDKYAA